MSETEVSEQTYDPSDAKAVFDDLKKRGISMQSPEGMAAIRKLGAGLKPDAPTGKVACKRCSTPHPPKTLKRCGRCMTAVYCSRECQVQDWKAGGHSKACQPKVQASSSSTTTKSQTHEA